MKAEDSDRECEERRPTTTFQDPDYLTMRAEDIDRECETLGQQLVAVGWRFIDAAPAIAHYRFELEHGTAPGAAFNEMTRRFEGPDRVRRTAGERLQTIQAHAESIRMFLEIGNSLELFYAERAGR